MSRITTCSPFACCGWVLRLALLSVAAWSAPACAPPVGDNTNQNTNMNDNGEANQNQNDNDNDNANQNDNDNGGADGDDQVAGLPLSSFRSENFMGSGNCTVCHSGLQDATGADVSIGEEWRGTLMANAARDPYFLAAVQSEIQHAPAPLREIIEDTCAACHMPMARTQAATEGTAVAILDDGFLDPLHPLHGAAMDGVSCTLCHQVQNDNLGEMDSFSGGFRIDTAAEPPGRPLFGPYQDPEQNLMQVSVGYTPTYGEHVTTSALCATCHNLFTPTLDAQGNVVGQFPEQTPFLEWQHSEFGNGTAPLQHCQDCHMPVADGAVKISTVPAGLESRTPFYRHQFLGGNVFMLRLLRENIEELELTASSDDFDDAVALTEKFLAEQTATLGISNAQIQGDTLNVTLQLDNRAGHKFPTSFPSRRAWIHMQVITADGQSIFDSGAAQPDGRIAGNDGDEDPTTYEPHHDVIRSAQEVQIYEPVMANTDGDVTRVLLRADRYLKDNRLLPRGFDKAAASADIAVMGQAGSDENFVGGSDHITYEIDIAGGQLPLTVRASLYYQSVGYRFIEDLRNEEGDVIEGFVDMADATGNQPARVASTQTTVP